ncbi:MAG TPA: extracellular solute-binding protein [bacterium]|nr:extracellular solute-binding protein [bacterium]HPN34337.1 extracellular solute-binding protein [bacterium]
MIRPLIVVCRTWFLSLLFFLYACRTSDPSKSGVLSFNVPANMTLLQNLRNQLGTFEKQNHIKVKLIPFTGQEKLYAMMAAGQPPDVFYTNTVVRDQLAAEGRLLDLYTVVAQDPFIHEIRPVFIERGTSIDGGWYQFCDWTFTYGIYFNKSLFDRQHVPYPDSAWTWQDLVQYSRALTKDTDQDGKIDRYGVFIAKHFVSALETMNGAVYPANALFFELPPESRQALQSYLDLMYRDKVMPELAMTQAQGMQGAQMLNSGRVAMVAEAVPNLDFITSLTVDWDVAPFPRMTPLTPRYFRSASGGLSISSSCRNPEKAWALIKWLVTSSPYNTPNPVLNSVDVVSGWEAQHPRLAQTHFGQVWRLSERYDGGDSRDFVRYFSWSSNAILEELGPMMDRVFSGQMSLEELALATPAINAHARREMDKALSNPSLKGVFREKIKASLQAYEAGIHDGR